MNSCGRPLPHSFNVSRCIQSRPQLLPFLYQTRSIRQSRQTSEQHSAYQPPAGPSANTFVPFEPTEPHPSHVNPKIIRYRSWYPQNKPNYQAPNQDDPWSYLYTPPSERPPPEPAQPSPEELEATAPEIPLHNRGSNRAAHTKRPYAKQVYRNPMTIAEMQTFGRIFKTLAAKSASQRTLNSEENEGQVSFGSAAHHRLPPTLRAIAERAAKAGIAARQLQEAQRVAPRWQPQEGRKHKGQLTAEQKAMNERFTGMVAALKRCENDLEALGWMEDHVFSLLQDEKTPAEELHFMYPALLAAGLELFHTKFGDVATVMALFDRAKNLGKDSYVLGCNTRVYNRMLMACWEGFREPRRIAELIQEMKTVGVEPDLNTRKVLQTVLEEESAVARGEVCRDGQQEWVKTLRDEVERIQGIPTTY